MAPSPFDYREAGASAKPEEMIAYTQWKKGMIKSPQPKLPHPKTEVVQVETMSAKPKEQGSLAPSSPSKSPKGGKGLGKGGKKSGNQKDKKNERNEQQQRSSITVHDLTQMFSQALQSLDRPAGNVGGRTNRLCTSICWRCNKRGHLMRNCRQPEGKVMCILAEYQACPLGGTHACECGQWHWAPEDDINPVN